MKTILIVEDDDTLRGLFASAIAAYPRLDVVEARTLAEALTCLQEQKIDCIVVDLGLDDSQGFDTFDVLNKAAPSLPLLVITGHIDDDLALRILKAGAQDFIKKPVMMSELFARVQGAINRHTTEERLYDLVECQTSLAANYRKMLELETKFDTLLQSLAGDQNAGRPRPTSLNAGNEGTIPIAGSPSRPAARQSGQVARNRAWNWWPRFVSRPANAG